MKTFKVQPPSFREVSNPKGLTRARAALGRSVAATRGCDAPSQNVGATPPSRENSATSFAWAVGLRFPNPRCGRMQCRATSLGILSCALVAAFSLGSGSVAAQNAFLKVNLVSDISSLAANTDTNLVNPWGIAASSTSTFWVANNRKGLSTLYDGSGAPQSLVVTVPPPSGPGPSAPTGVAYYGGTSFQISPGNPARFIFATADGTISAWNPASGTSAIQMIIGTAIYKGLAIASTGSGDFLYAANFKNGTIDVFNGNFAAAALAGSFTDPVLPSGYAPFNIQNLNGRLYVAYAHQNASGTNDLPGAGNGIVDVFDFNGIFVQRLITGGALNSPWGLALAPSTLAGFAGNLLVANSGDGRINAYNPTNGVLNDVLRDGGGNPLVIQGLHGLIFGNGGNGGDPKTLYFTAGIAGSGSVGDHGLLGSLAQGAESPRLSIARTATNTVRVFWPSPSTGFNLQFNTNLTTPSWATPAETFYDDGTNKYILVSPPVGNRYYRLYKP